MSAYVQAVDGFGVSQPDALAFRNSQDESITYGELKRASDALAARLAVFDPSGAPVVVYGHKSPLMLVAFFACAKSGRAYVPIDVMYPDLRVLDIMSQLGTPLVLNTTAQDVPQLVDHAAACWDCSDIGHAVGTDETTPGTANAPLTCVSDGDTFYILFTSGSTGRPKGVEVTAECVDNFWRWMLDAFGTHGSDEDAAQRRQRVFFDRAPFSFDLSVTDLVLGLGAGDTMFALVEDDEADLARAFAALRDSSLEFWVSTASFADMCLRDPAFNREMLPAVKTFFFVGETLKNDTAAKLLGRFDGCEVINGYGPTESTDLVTATAITPEMTASSESLPVGTPRPGTELYILDPETLEPVATGQPGELFIVGDTVAKGYFGRPDLTEAAFHSCPESIARGRRSYRTGDKAFVDETGMLHFRGRLDFQIKLHGYRIELGEIEAALCKLDGVEDACVLPIERRGSISHLTACVAMPAACANGVLDDDAAARFDLTQCIKDGLRALLPEYMVPRKVVVFDQLPLNMNNKIDRNRLRELV